MKNILKIIPFLFFAVNLLTAQAPTKMSYQAVVRNSNNQLAVNQTVGVRISILEDSLNGNIFYQETQQPQTNSNGQIDLLFGGGSGFNNIDWEMGPYFIRTEIDLGGGTNYTISGTSQLLSVPYALYAKEGGSKGILNTTVINANCGSSASPGTTFVKIGDIGTFTKLDADSKIEATFNGRIGATSTSGSGLVFELRIDDNATSMGRAAASLRSEEVPGTVQTSITGIFSGLSTGSHTVSLWVKTYYGTSGSAMYDPGCWSTDVVIVKEIR